MGEFVKGDVVVVPFPFSNLQETKRRPALVVAALTGQDIILCMITSRARSDGYSIDLRRPDFSLGRLPTDSYILPNRLFTADSAIVIKKAGKIGPKKIHEVEDKIIEIVKA